MRTFRITIVGCGAIGASMAACLHASGQVVTMCSRTAREIDVRRDGEPPIIAPGPVVTDPASLAPSDLVLLAVKATQTASSAPFLSALCREHTVVCVLQNGVEQVETVTPFVRGAHVLPAVVWFSAETQAAGWVRLRNRPRILFPERLEAQQPRDVLEHAGCMVELVADFTSAAWHKLLMNAVVGMMALTGRRTAMFARADIDVLARAYLRECLAVARAEGATLADDVPDRIVDQLRSYPPDTGSSILADRVASRPMEWDQRNGVILRRARMHGIPAPISETLVPLLAATSDG